MSSANDSRASPAAVAFLQMFLQDRQQGRIRDLAAYQAAFPAHAQIIAQEHAALLQAVPGPGDGSLAMAADGQRYRDPVPIGSGGMGTVYRVFDPALERTVAMKVFGGTDGALPEPRLLARFLAEAKVTGRLQHPGIVSVFEIGVDGRQRPYFTMPWIAGKDLHAILQARQRGDPDWPLVRVLDVLVRVCEAVAYAHERGVLHRDLKPANVMVGAFGETYVVDWGLAHCDPVAADAAAEPASAGSPNTQAGEVLGTPAYMAPEQANGEVVGPGADVYALGAMLYHVLTGQVPYATGGEPISSAVTLERLRSGPPPPVSRLAATTPPELLAICDRAMARDPGQRYPSVADLRADLRAFLENRVVAAFASGPFAELGKWMRRNRALAVVSGLALVALVLGLVVSLEQRAAADRHAGIATENFELAFAAAEDLLGRIGFHDLEQEPGADPLRLDLSRKALAYYQRFLELRGDQPRIAERLALAHWRIGMLHSQLGQADEAAAALATAATAWERLLPRAKDPDACREKICSIALEQQVIGLQRGRTAEAAVGLASVLADLEGLLARHPDSTSLVRTAGSAAHNLALALQAEGDLPRALQCAERKLHLSERLVALAPAQPLAHAQLGSAQQLQASVLWRLQQFDAAEDAFVAGAEGLAAALATHPGHRGLRARLGELLNLHAVMLREQQRVEAATELFERAVAWQRQLVAEFPGVRNYHGNLGGTLCNLGILASLRDEHDAAIACLTEAVPEIRRALAIDPDAADYRNYRRIAGNELAIALLGAGRHADAADAVRQLIADLPDSSRWNAGRLFAVCAKVCRRDPALADEARAELAEAYASQAVAWLREAAVAGAGKPETLAGSAFEALRDRADFQALIELLRR